MEAVAYIAGESHSDTPKCVCPVIGAAARRINDWMTQAERDEFLAPILFDFAGTVGTREDKVRRGYIAADFAVRVFAPMRMRARKHVKLAELMEAIPPITDKASAISARGKANEVRSAAATAAAHAAAAHAAAAAYAAYAAAYAADAAAAAAADAAYAAADAAARRRVCEAATQMLRDMIAVKHDDPCEWARSPESLPCLVS
jgi:hypothetical protein